MEPTRPDPYVSRTSIINHNNNDNHQHHFNNDKYYDNFTLFNNQSDHDDIMAMYLYRSVPYTVLAVLAATFNLLSLVAILMIRRPRTVYHSLLANLAAGDILGSMLVWLYHNSVVLYPDFEEGDGGADGSLKICLLKSAGLLVPILLAMTNSALALLMLSFNQFLAICHPLFAQTRLAPEKVRWVILGVWMLSLGGSFVPVVVVLVQAYLEDCNAKIQSKTITSLEVCAYLLASLILVVIFLYARIYREVLKCRKRSIELSMTSRKPMSSDQSTAEDTSENRVREQLKSANARGLGSRTLISSGTATSDRSNILGTGRSRQQQFQQPLLLRSSPGSTQPPYCRHYSLGSPETNYKAFMTTLLMTGTLLFFWLPYLLISSLSMYSSDSEMSDYPDLLLNLKFYIIDFLPLLNYISDPIVYGVRIRCVRLSFVRLYGTLCRRFYPTTARQDRSEGSKLPMPTNAANGRITSGPNTVVQEFSFCAQ